MIKITSDVDIDVFNRDKILDEIGCVFGRIDRNENKTEKHPTGVYFQNIPRDPVTNIATLDYKLANEYGYFKIDFLNVNMYEGIKNEAHLIELLHREVPWDFFQFAEITDQLFHLRGYSHLLKRFPPTSVEDIAMVLAIIRPSKAYLQKENWEKVRSEVWTKTDDSYQFKRSHGIAYALAIVVNLNLLIEQMSRA